MHVDGLQPRREPLRERHANRWDEINHLQVLVHLDQGGCGHERCDLMDGGPIDDQIVLAHDLRGNGARSHRSQTKRFRSEHLGSVVSVHGG